MYIKLDTNGEIKLVRHANFNFNYPNDIYVDSLRIYGNYIAQYEDGDVYFNDKFNKSSAKLLGDGFYLCPVYLFKINDEEAYYNGKESLLPCTEDDLRIIKQVINNIPDTNIADMYDEYLHCWDDTDPSEYCYREMVDED